MSVSEKEILTYLAEVKDPEVPVLDIVEMGIIRGVRFAESEVVVQMTPTYSGCPALKMIEDEIVAKLSEKGVAGVRVETVLAPPWTTDWMTEEAREKLREVGIAPPGAEKIEGVVPFSKLSNKIPCPRCSSLNTRVTSEFGATACKSLAVWDDCREPFECFKAI